MLILNKHLPDFYQFLRITYGMQLIEHDHVKKFATGEFARAFYNGSLFLIRETGEGSEFAEVIYKDKEWLKDMNMIWSSLLEDEEENVQE